MSKPAPLRHYQDMREAPHVPPVHIHSPYAATFWLLTRDRQASAFWKARAGARVYRLADSRSRHDGKSFKACLGLGVLSHVGSAQIARED